MYKLAFLEFQIDIILAMYMMRTDIARVTTIEQLLIQVSVHYMLQRWMYWADHGAEKKIEKASMDGRMRTVLHDTDLPSYFVGLTLDYTTQTLFWTNGQEIYSSNVNGLGQKRLTTELPNIFGYGYGITVFKDVLYLEGSSEIHSVNKSSEQILATTSFSSRCSHGIQIISEQRQLHGK